jgi:hypothetical protein
MFDAEHLRLITFVKCIKEDGIEAFSNYILRNHENGIMYHKNGIHGDYDDFDTEEEILHLLRTGEKKFKMSENKIENYIADVLVGDTQKNASDFIAFLRGNDMFIERFTYHGDDTLHWIIKYSDNLVCYVLLDDERQGWTIMPDNSSTGRFADYPIDEAMKEIAWKNLNICVDGRCGGCGEGTGKRLMIFGKEIENVCPMAFNFTNPDALALKLAMKMMDVRKSDIEEQN